MAGALICEIGGINSLPPTRGSAMKKRLIRLDDVMKMTSLSRSSIYSYVSDGLFPRPVKVGRRAVAWRELDVIDWITSRT